MSRNYELLQQAEIDLTGAPTFTAGGKASEAEAFDLPVAEKLSALEPQVREETLKLVQRLFLTRGQAAPKAVVFAAIDSKNGCSWLCTVVAKLLAKSVPGTVCLMEGNFRAPVLPRLLGVENHRGLADALQQDGTIRGFVNQIGPDNLWLLSSGSLGQDSPVLLNGDRTKQRVDELRKAFDYLLIDAPPLNAFSDGMVLSRLVDGVVLVLEANTTRREVAVRVTESLRASNIPVLGAVLNNRTFPIPAALYKRI